MNGRYMGSLTGGFDVTVFFDDMCEMPCADVV